MYAFLYGDDLPPPERGGWSYNKPLVSVNKWHLPIAWLALFEPQDVWLTPGLEGGVEDDGAAPRISRPRTEALNLLRFRRDWILRVFPACDPAWLSAFDNIVDTATCNWLHLEATDFVDEVEVLRRMVTMFDELPEPMPGFDDPSPWNFGPPEVRNCNGTRFLPYVELGHEERLANQGLPGWDEYANIFLGEYSGSGQLSIQAFIGLWGDRTAPLLAPG